MESIQLTEAAIREIVRHEIQLALAQEEERQQANAGNAYYYQSMAEEGQRKRAAREQTAQHDETRRLQWRIEDLEARQARKGAL